MARTQQFGICVKVRIEQEEYDGRKNDNTFVETEEA